MKKLLSLALALVLVVACAFTVMAEDVVGSTAEPTTYLWLKGEYTGNTETDVQPSISWVIENADGDGGVLFEQGVTYYPYAICKFDEGSTGTVYCNCYCYNTVESALGQGTWTDSDGDHLMSFRDFALCSDYEAGEWVLAGGSDGFGWDFWTPSWGSHGADESLGAITMGIGFWQASGGIAVNEMGVMDAEGNKIVTIDFADGLEIADDNEYVYCNLPRADQGVVWDVEGAKVIDLDKEVLVEGENIAVGKSYTISGLDSRGDAWDDNGTKYVDGVYNTNGGDTTNNLGGKVTEGAKVEVVINLGGVENIHGLYTMCLGNDSWGIASPSQFNVTYSVSDDGETWTELATVEPQKVDEANWDCWEYVLNQDAEAAYVKVTYNKDAGHIWIGGASVIGDAAVDPDPVDPTPATGDAGVVALAVVAAIAFAGVVVAKKSK